MANNNLVEQKEWNIVCPKCNGEGKITKSERCSSNEDSVTEHVCSYCNGNRVVIRKVTIEDIRVGALNIAD